MEFKKYKIKKGASNLLNICEKSNFKFKINANNMECFEGAFILAEDALIEISLNFVFFTE